MDKYQKIYKAYQDTIVEGKKEEKTGGIDGKEELGGISQTISEMLDEGMGSEAVLKNIRWEQMMYKFFDIYNMMKGAASNKKNKKAQIAYRSAESMLKDLQKFIDSFSGLEKLEKAATKEVGRLAGMNVPR
jgi:hypothetical protein